MVHTVQMEEGLQSFRRLGQAAAPFVRPRAETVAEPTPEFANATLNFSPTASKQLPISTQSNTYSSVSSVVTVKVTVVVVIVIIINNRGVVVAAAMATILARYTREIHV